MEDLDWIQSASLDELDSTAFAEMGCIEHGIVVLCGATSWRAHERGYIELPTNRGLMVVHIAYDEREAPYAIDTDGNERRNLLISLSDEKEHLACTWARVDEGSPLVGLGVDLCEKTRFREREGRRDLGRLLLTEHEQQLVPMLAPDDPLLAKAVLFGAKEAGFKSTAHALRRWYEHHDEQLLFEVRHFVMEEPGLERGTGRNAAAQQAMDKMGIERVVIHHAEVEGMALVVGLALR